MRLMFMSLNVMYLFGAVCSPSCATYALMRTALDNADKFPKDAVNEVLRSFYVDDFLTSSEDDHSAVELARNVSAILASGGFRLTKWVCTSKNVLEATDDGATEINRDLEDSPTSRVLGVHWQVSNDRLTFRKKQNFPSNLLNTKRSLLSLVCTIFDPLGVLAPYIIRSRILVQSLWSAGLGWDEPIGDETLKIWSNWISKIDEIENLNLPRKYWPVDFIPSKTALHVFCDSSERAYAAVCYLRVESTSGQVHTSFIMSRSRVAPSGKKSISLPRLELQAAVLAVRLANTVQEEIDLKFESVQFWSDSNIVLQYIGNDKRRFKTFVGNHIAEIRATTEPDQWHHCPGTLNPSDLATRGTLVKEITHPKSVWLRLPSFLGQPQSDWPENTEIRNINENDSEIKKTVILTTSFDKAPTFVDPGNFSSLQELLRIVSVSWVTASPLTKN